MISIILPSYKEYDNLKILLPAIEKELYDINFEVLIIDTTESLDDTKELCKEYSFVRYYNREIGNNYGDAIRTGIKYSKMKYIIIMDADGSHTVDKIRELYHCIEKENLDLAICSRYIKGGDSNNGIILKCMSLIVNLCYRIVFNLKVKDVSNSFRIYKSNMIKSVKLECNNFDIVEEILIKLISKYKNIKIKEIPIYFNKRIYGKSKRHLIRFIFSYIFSIIKLYNIKDDF